MEKLKIQLENCYGIKNLKEELDFSSGNSFAIYAPNGVMKTSFAKAFQDLSNEKESEDRIFRDRQTIRIVKNENDIDITKEKVFVIVPYSEEFKSEKLSTLLANKGLKEEYKQIRKSIEEKKELLIRELKASSGLTKDIEETISDVFTYSPRDFFKALGRVESEVIEGNTSGFENISYKKLFGDKKVVDFLKTPDFNTKLAEYTQIYDRLLSSSTYFKKGIFNHNNASVIAKTLKDNGFFKASHTVSLNAPGGRKEITTEQELETVIQQEKDVILENPDLAKSFEEIDSKLKANKELRDFRDYLNENQNILPELTNLDRFKQKIWVAYLSKSVGAFKALMDEYSPGKKKIGEIIAKAKLETTKWQKVINIFNERFSVPFVVDIKNQEDVILRSEAPSIKFEFKDDDGEAVVPVEEKHLWNILSNGERRALYILNIIFEVEARKENQQETLFVIDDIADSFDYKNKYAIIEYLHEISQIENFYQIILSHNFDFFRTICSRLKLKRGNRLHVVKSSVSVRLTEEKYQNNPFADWKNNLADDNKLIAAIPFIRNLAEYCGFKDNYNKLTSLLHMKSSTDSITVGALQVLIQEILQNKEDLALGGKDRKVKDVIYSSADLILNENEEIIDLEKKIVLSIAIRLKAEVFLIQQINNEEFVADITKNQTCALIEKYKKMFPNENQNIKFMERVNLMTPENIHLNSFMYEPILDMSNEHLKQLYQNVCQLGSPFEVTAS